ncbi:MAG: aminoacyl-tRNA hydrolase [Clostridiales bacterium 43-6]|nr:MAG: aminoacyl-tRNA hydrolase [Clostridiales bacterium 43-6]
MFSLFKKSTSSPEFLVVGLGNPGGKYDNTRHNVGFSCIDKLCETHGISVSKLKFKALYGDGIIDGTRCLLIKPQTYMNHSGEAVSEFMNFYKIPAENVLVIFDDISLAVGKLRIRRNGTHGGHKGMKSIIELTDTTEYPRIKIGVGNKPHPDYDLADWVLSKFQKCETDGVKRAIEHSAEAVKLMVNGNTDKAMNLYNS